VRAGTSLVDQMGRRHEAVQIGHVLEHHRVVTRPTEVGLDQLDQTTVVGAVDTSVGHLGVIDVEEDMVGRSGRRPIRTGGAGVTKGECHAPHHAQGV